MGAPGQAGSKSVYTLILQERPYLDESLWQRFLYHASLVQNLHIIHGSRQPDEVEAYRALGDYNQDRALLPSLRSLWWTHKGDPRDRIVLSVLLPSSLQKLFVIYERIRAWNLAEDLEMIPPRDENLLPFLASRCHGLELLEFWHVFTEGRLMVPDLLSFSHLNMLFLLHSCLGPPEVRTLLAALPLRQFGFVASGFANATSDEALIEAPQLRLLRVTGTCAVAAGVTAVIRAPVLDWVHVSVTDEDTMHLSDFKVFMRNIFSTDFSQNLLKVTIWPDNYEETPRRHPPTAGARASLMEVIPVGPVLASLRHLSIHVIPTQFSLSFTDDNVRVFTQASPELRAFAVLCIDPQLSLLTPHALLFFATYCPKLEILSLEAMDGAPVVIPESAPTPGHPLASLVVTVPRSALQDPQAFAAMLNLLFPDPGFKFQCNAHWRMTNEQREGWPQVHFELAKLRSRTRRMSSDAALSGIDTYE
ncbi:hypothetical protein BN946_scf185007.g275 [Trametes cinnabarina]|uniref:F-box domain-containing protein n=1 Tax=Pycnoporus cinnabarinus TaxID=5643 RepID=A0A060SFR6_PYCCI|nr:hypothetical protein BN946_scf185007.g275 [Trametes cinnabarina]